MKISENALEAIKPQASAQPGDVYLLSGGRVINYRLEARQLNLRWKAFRALSAKRVSYG